MKAEACASECEVKVPDAYIRDVQSSVMNPLHEAMILYENERGDLLKVVDDAVRMSKGGSVLIVGPQGSGKTLLVRGVVESLRKKLNKSLSVTWYHGLLNNDEDSVPCPPNEEALLVILEQFEQFCLVNRQTFLYSLFELTLKQTTASSSVCVVFGITTRCDCIELMEKRVRSRFSQRQIVMSNLPFDRYILLAKNILCPPPAHKSWTKHITDVIFNEKSPTCALLRSIYDRTRNLHMLRNFLQIAVLRLHQRKIFVHADFVESYRQLCLDPVACQLQSLTMLELIILIAAMRVAQRHSQCISFSLVYSEYLNFVSNRRSLAYTKLFVRKAFDHLMTLRLIQTSGNDNAFIPDTAPLHLAVTPSQILETLNKYHDCPFEISQWASFSLHQ